MHPRITAAICTWRLRELWITALASLYIKISALEQAAQYVTGHS